MRAFIHTVSPPNLRARCQKWTICSVPGGRFALIFLCLPVAPRLAARLSARLIRLDDKVCDICKLPASLLFCYPAVVCVGEHDSQCALCVKGCHCSSHPVTPYCVAVMGILSCHAIINIPPGKSKRFAVCRRVYGS